MDQTQASPSSDSVRENLGLLLAITRTTADSPAESELLATLAEHGLSVSPTQLRTAQLTPEALACTAKFFSVDPELFSDSPRGQLLANELKELQVLQAIKSVGVRFRGNSLSVHDTAQLIARHQIEGS